jgi:predicted porin
MKKSLLALAVLGAFSGLASAQSSVTIFGLVDANVGKDIGSDDKRVGQGAQSRLGFRGTEDLGNGLRAFFHIQHRFDSGTGNGIGTPSSGQTPFWQAEANVGLAGNFGNVRIGRNYTEAFYHQVTADPWGYDTVANLKAFITGGAGTTGIAADRANNAVSYWITQSGITFGAQIAEANDNAGSGSNHATPGGVGQKRPTNFRLTYAAGPIAAGVSYDNPSDNDDNWTLVNGSYNMGVAKVGAFYGDGKNASALKRKSFGVTATAPFGPGEARAGYGQLKGPASAVTGPEIKLRQQFSLGYHYSLSKRTTIYGDVASTKTDLPGGSAANSLGANLKTSDSAYDFGIKHVF